MPKMIQIRGVPDPLHRTLKARAAREGMSLSDYLKRELARTAEQPTMQEWLERTAKLPRLRPRRSAVEVIRELREEG